jgi:RecB family endonuclease NucS
LDREIIVFEVKAAADPDDVESFADKVELVRHQNPNIKVDGVLVSLGADARVRRRCAEKGLRLIP